MRAFCLLIFIFSARAQAQVDVNWSESEHLALGEKGALQACHEAKIAAKDCPTKQIQRLDKKTSFTYGELVASADFYDEPIQLDQDKRSGINWVIRCAHKAASGYADPNPPRPDSSDCTFTGLLAIPGYLEILTRNYSHFGWNNMTAYVKNHQLALEKAREAFLKKSKPQESLRLLHQAMIYNGFADHYLTDAFSSGHIRVPRIQIKKWAVANLQGPLVSYRGDLLSLLLHDHESRNLQTGEEEGLRVKNSLGQVWLTPGDGELHGKINTEDLAFVMPLQALKESFKEVLIAWKTGKIPAGSFSAATFVPFNYGVSLVTKFSADYQQITRRRIMRLLYGSVPFFEGLWFQKSDLEKMFDSLPQIYSKFQLDIAQEIQTNPELPKRLPPAYLEAFKQVQ